MRFKYKLISGLYSLKYTLLGIFITFLITSASLIIYINWIILSLIGICIIIPPNIYPKLQLYKQYYIIIGLVSIIIAILLSIIWINVFQFIGLIICKGWFLSNIDNPNYPLNVNFFNMGVIIFLSMRLNLNSIMIAFLLLCNILCIILVEHIWCKHRMIGLLRFEEK